jgi:2-methylcitrate dehydratase PrpD
MTVVAEWARNIKETHYENIDPRVIEGAKLRVIDVIGCAIGGVNGDGCSMILDLIKEWGGKPESTILVHGIKTTAHCAAMVNSIMARSYDFEPSGPATIDGRPALSHISGTMVPVAFAVGETAKASGKELLTALILGEDVASRLVAASVPQLEPWDPIGTVNKFGAAATTGKLLGLNEQQQINAFGIVINQAAGSFQTIIDKSHSFKLYQGLAAQDGIFSAKLAQKGWSGLIDPLFSKCGYFALYCQSSQPDILTKELGKFGFDGPHKVYPSCGRTLAAVNCAWDLVQKYDLKAEDIAEVIVNVTTENRNSPVGQQFHIGGSPQASALFSIQYGVASALVRKDVRLEYYVEDCIRDQSIMDFIKKIKLADVMPPEKDLAAELRVIMKDGTEYFSAPAKRLLSTMSEIKEKFMTNVAFSKTITTKKANAALNMLENLEEIKDINQVVKLLVARRS